MQIHIYSPVHFEKWDWRNSVEKGIGGSETCHVEMAWRFAQRGYEVVSYTPIPDDCPGRWRGTIWKRLEDADFTAPGIWVIYRDAACVDQMPGTDQRIWLMCQDEVPRGVTSERAEKIEIVLALCEWHQRHIEANLPCLKGKTVITSNGVKGELIRDVEVDKPERNPRRLIYASSPDRGLIPLLKIFKRAREFVPDLELHCFYGLDNIDKLIEFNPQFKHYKQFKAELLQAVDQPGVTWRGRVSQQELYREWLTTGIWCYPCSAFSETSCITSMEAQALGAIPVVSPRAALAENVKWGHFIPGDANGDVLVRARFAAEIVRLALQSELQEEIRGPMMLTARTKFNWERQVDHWEGLANRWSYCPIAQFSFQRRHLEGRTLNIGCADDPAHFGKLNGAVNVDVVAEIPWTGKKTAAQILHDVREPLPESLGQFDTVIIGDMLEHLSDADAISVLLNAKAALVEGGRVVVTCPEDYRPVEQQHVATDCKYPDGESAYHERPITLDMIREWFVAAGLNLRLYQGIDYGHFLGHGAVADVESTYSHHSALKGLVL